MKKFLNSFVYAFRGVRAAFAAESSLRLEGIAGVVVIGAGLYVKLQPWEWVAVLICIAMVLGLELMNSAVENLVDLVTREHHPLAGKVKDIAAGAVVVVSILAAAIALIIFYPYFF